MVHRQETMRLLGFPVVRYIDIDDSEEVLRAIRLPTARCQSTREAKLCPKHVRGNSPVPSGLIISNNGLCAAGLSRCVTDDHLIFVLA
jgi:hypothetical protein